MRKPNFFGTMLSANTVRCGQSLAFAVAALSLEHVVRATERWFRVDHPVLSEQWPQPGGEDFGLSERVKFPFTKEMLVGAVGIESASLTSKSRQRKALPTAPHPKC